MVCPNEGRKELEWRRRLPLAHRLVGLISIHSLKVRPPQTRIRFFRAI